MELLVVKLNIFCSCLKFFLSFVCSFVSEYYSSAVEER